MIFIETLTFFKSAQGLLPDDELRNVQEVLTACPNIGVIIPGAGGLRKMRWAGCHRGKRGGLRIIYYLVTADHKIFLLYVYRKSVREDMTLKELKMLKDILES